MWLTHPSVLSRDTAPSAADRTLKAYQQSLYVKELWLLLTAVIGLLTVINWSSRLLRYLLQTKRDLGDAGSSIEKTSPEALGQGRTGRISLRRVPDAVASMFKVVAFRTTVPIGTLSVMSVTELTFIVGYIVAILIWLWVDSKCDI